MALRKKRVEVEVDYDLIRARLMGEVPKDWRSPAAEAADAAAEAEGGDGAVAVLVADEPTGDSSDTNDDSPDAILAEDNARTRDMADLLEGPVGWDPSRSTGEIGDAPWPPLKPEGHQTNGISTDDFFSQVLGDSAAGPDVAIADHSGPVGPQTATFDFDAIVGELPTSEVVVSETAAAGDTGALTVDLGIDWSAERTGDDIGSFAADNEPFIEITPAGRPWQLDNQAYFTDAFGPDDATDEDASGMRLPEWVSRLEVNATDDVHADIGAPGSGAGSDGLDGFDLGIDVARGPVPAALTDVGDAGAAEYAVVDDGFGTPGDMAAFPVPVDSVVAVADGAWPDAMVDTASAEVYADAVFPSDGAGPGLGLPAAPAGGLAPAVIGSDTLAGLGQVLHGTRPSGRRRKIGPAILKGWNLYKYHRTPSAVIPGIDGVDLTAHAGELIVVTGAVGSGKSTLLQCISGRVDLDDGQVFVDGQAIHAFSDEETENFREVASGYVHPVGELNGDATVIDILTRPLVLLGQTQAEAEDHVGWVVKYFSLESVANRTFATLTASEQGRVSVARALVSEPQVMWADDPIADLGPEAGAEQLEAIHRLWVEGMTVIVVAHEDLSNDVTLSWPARRVTLEEGRIVQDLAA